MLSKQMCEQNNQKGVAADTTGQKCDSPMDLTFWLINRQSILNHTSRKSAWWATGSDDVPGRCTVRAAALGQPGPGKTHPHLMHHIWVVYSVGGAVLEIESSLWLLCMMFTKRDCSFSFLQYVCMMHAVIVYTRHAPGRRLDRKPEAARFSFRAAAFVGDFKLCWCV